MSAIRTIVIVVFLVLLLPSSAKVSALSCVPPNIYTRFEKSDIVFLGSVVNTTKDENTRETTAEFKIWELFKGNLDTNEMVKVTDTAFAGSQISFAETNDELIVFAQRENDRLVTGNCNGSAEYSHTGVQIYGYENRRDFVGDLFSLKYQYISSETIENLGEIESKLQENSEEIRKTQIYLGSLAFIGVFFIIYFYIRKNKS